MNASQRGGDRASTPRESAGAETGRRSLGRPPSDEPDVFLEVPNLHVGRLEIDVERLDAQLALRAQVANLVNLVAGVHAGVDKVRIELEDVDASALLTVRLQNIANILDRTLTTIDEHPEILQGVVDAAGGAVEQVGAIGSEATKPGGALSELTSGVGDTFRSLGDTLSTVTDNVNPRRLLSGARRGGSNAKSRSAADSGNGVSAKVATGLAAGGVAGLLGGALYRAQRRPRVLGVPIGRRRGVERITKEIASVANGKELKKARKRTEKALS